MAGPFTPGDQFTSPGTYSNQSQLDEYAANPRFQELQTTLRSYLFDEARSAGNTRQQTPDAQPEFSQRLEGHKLLLQHLTQGPDQIALRKKIKYLNVWITECAPWLDMFDQERHFGIHVPVLAQRSPAVCYALLALSARQMERHGGLKGASQDSLELYSHAIASLAPSINARDPEVLVTACILCVLEMMSVSPRDWRRHSEGCAALFENLGVNGLSGGLMQAVFWCYARMDLCAAIIADGAESTTLPIPKWAIVDVPLASFHGILDQQRLISQTFFEKGSLVADMHANYAVYLCAKVCDLLARRTRFVELHEDNGCTNDVFQQTWLALWDETQLWFEKRPPPMLPVKEVPNVQGKELFPRILFAHWAAISSNQLFHVANILMVELKPASVDVTRLVGSRPLLWHARRIVGISLTNPHKGCLNNAIQPLWVAGKLFTHREEHKVIVDLLNKIEASSGWGSRWRIKDLEAVWGYRVEQKARKEGG